MTSYLNDKIDSLSKDIDVLFYDYISIDNNTSFENIDFHRVRGSVRMTSEKILLPFEIEVERKKVIQLDFA